jgi:hypothetical protein
VNESKLIFFSLCLCIPITLLIDLAKMIIGDPDEPCSVFIICLNSKPFIIPFIFPLAISISSFGYCKANKSISKYFSYPFV